MGFQIFIAERIQEMFYLKLSYIHPSLFIINQQILIFLDSCKKVKLLPEKNPYSG